MRITKESIYESLKHFLNLNFLHCIGTNQKIMLQASDVSFNNDQNL